MIHIITITCLSWNSSLRRPIVPTRFLIPTPNERTDPLAYVEEYETRFFFFRISKTLGGIVSGGQKLVAGLEKETATNSHVRPDQPNSNFPPHPIRRGVPPATPCRPAYRPNPARPFPFDHLPSIDRKSSINTAVSGCQVISGTLILHLIYDGRHEEWLPLSLNEISDPF
jgi:hypothetical protein